ncbi:MAG TPA: AMP-binding protein, partial [Streptosporangiaceae bacterium]|nr:AMP-binding protein [Streptosporangiaceae bacterium]
MTRSPAHDAEITGAPPTIPAALARAAEKWPDDEALIDGPVRLCFREYRDLSVGIARGLISCGVRAGDRVVIWAPNSVEAAATAMAVASAGAVLVPLNTRFTAYEAAELIRRVEPAVALAFTDFLGRDYLASLQPSGVLDQMKVTVALRGPASPGTISLDELLARSETTAEEEVYDRERALGGNDISDILFTSGTTGSPKGAMLRHGAGTRGYTEYSRSLGLRPGDRLLGLPPFFHCFGLKAVVLASVLHGATVLPVPVFDVHRTAELIARERITVLQGAPVIFRALLDDPAVDRSSLSSLRVAAPGAMGSSAELYTRLRDELGIRQFAPGYGLTEGTAVGTRCYWFDDFETISTTSGRPVPGTELRIADDAGRPRGPGQDGEILLRGYNIMAGYFQDPVATAQVIDADGWLHTGDIGRLDEQGRLTVTDRKKDMFLVGGFNTYPAEIEGVLGEHPAVAEASVIGVPDERLGEVGMAFIILRPGTVLTEAEMTSWARERLANYKVPRHWRFVSELPRNASGKVRKFLLREEA